MINKERFTFLLFFCFSDLLPTHYRRKIHRSHRKIPEPPFISNLTRSRQQTRNNGGPTTTTNLQRIHLRFTNGNREKDSTQEHSGRTKTTVRNGCIFHALQTPTNPSNTYTQNSSEHVL